MDTFGTIKGFLFVVTSDKGTGKAVQVISAECTRSACKGIKDQFEALNPGLKLDWTFQPKAEWIE